jgi:hypothetical protein
MTTRFRIALIGLPEKAMTATRGLFRENGMDAEAFDAASVDLADPGRFGGYDLVIADPSLAGGEDEERFLSFLLSMRSFLIFEGTSLEEILAAAQDVLYGGNVPGAPARKFPRVRVDLGVAYESGAAWRESRVRTLGENGAFIATLDPPPAGAPVKLLLSLPGKAERIAASGKTLYSIGYDLASGIISRPGAPDRKIGAFPGFGVVFEGISDADREALRRYIEGKRYGVCASGREDGHGTP